MSDSTTPASATPPKPARDYGKILLRALLMAAFVLMISIATYLVTLIAFVQVIWMLVTGERNARLSIFGTSLGRWLNEATRFQTVASEDKPFPWAGWPPSD